MEQQFVEEKQDLKKFKDNVANDAVRDIVKRFLTDEDLAKSIEEAQKVGGKVLLSSFRYNDMWTSPKNEYVKFNILKLYDEYNLCDELQREYDVDFGEGNSYVYFVRIEKGVYSTYISFKQDEWEEYRKHLEERATAKAEQRERGRGRGRGFRGRGFRGGFRGFREYDRGESSEFRGRGRGRGRGGYRFRKFDENGDEIRYVKPQYRRKERIEEDPYDHGSEMPFNEY